MNDHAAALLNTKRLDHLRAPYLEVRTLLLRIPTPGTLPLPSHYRSRSARYTLRDPVPHDYVSTFQLRSSLTVSGHLCTRKCTSKNRVTYAHEAVKNSRSIREHAANFSDRSRELFLSFFLFFVSLFSFFLSQSSAENTQKAILTERNFFPMTVDARFWKRTLPTPPQISRANEDDGCARI